MARWQGAMEHRQAFLGRIVDIGAELFAISAVCSRAKASGRIEELELADLFCRQARHRVAVLEWALWTNTDAADRAVAKQLTTGRYEFLEDGVLGLPASGDWVATWQPGPSTRPDVRRRIPRTNPMTPPTVTPPVAAE
jgi:hypothetical protein